MIVRLTKDLEYWSVWPHIDCDSLTCVVPFYAAHGETWKSFLSFDVSLRNTAFKHWSDFLSVCVCPWKTLNFRAAAFVADHHLVGTTYLFIVFHLLTSAKILLYQLSLNCWTGSQAWKFKNGCELMSEMKLKVGKTWLKLVKKCQKITSIFFNIFWFFGCKWCKRRSGFSQLVN